MEKITQVVQFLQSKSVNISVAEINQICQILNSIEKPKEVPKEEKKK